MSDPKKRLTASAALHHPWVRGGAAKSQHMENTMEKIKIFNARRKMKVCPNGFNIFIDDTTIMIFSATV